MRTRTFNLRLGILAVLSLTLVACAASDPEIVAIEYLRATREAKSDAALGYLDLDELHERISEDIVMVNTDGDPDTFLRESISYLIWGLFQETPREDLAYDALPADITANRATVRVRMVDAEGKERSRTVHLRNTDAGWRVSGRSLDDLVSYVITRLQERY
jgi:hypothetical protein